MTARVEIRHPDAGMRHRVSRISLTRGNVSTWSDGWGRFYAAVPGDSRDPRRMARDAIRRELVARGDIGPGYRIRVERAPLEWHTTADVDARPVWREVSA